MKKSTSSKIVSMLLTLTMVLGIFLAIPMTAGAADSDRHPYELTPPKTAKWNGDTATWTKVSGVVVYEYELYRNNTGGKQDPDKDEVIITGQVSTNSVDLSEHMSKKGFYYYIVCALSSDKKDGNGMLSWTNSKYLDKTKDTGSTAASSASSTATAATNEAVTIKSSDMKTLVSTAKSAGKKTVTSKGTSVVTVQAAAWKELAGMSFQHTTSVKNKTEVRITISDPSAITNNTKVSAYTTGDDVDKAVAFFQKSFSNTVRAIHFDKTGTWGQEVKIVAKISLANMDKDKLVFYYYDRAKGTHKKLDIKYTVDDNGFTNFSTTYAGNIIVSNGALVR